MEGEQLEDRRTVGEGSCNSGDETDQRVQSLTFMMMMMVANEQCRAMLSLKIRIVPQNFGKNVKNSYNL
jgi:hypothetical protein